MGTKVARFLISSKVAPQKMQFLGTIKKARKSGPVAPKCKVAENLHRIDRHRPEICLNPNFLAYSNRP